MKILFFLLWVLLPGFTKSAVAAEVRILADFYAHLDRAASVLKVQADLETQRSSLQAYDVV